MPVRGAGSHQQPVHSRRVPWRPRAVQGERVSEPADLAEHPLLRLIAARQRITRAVLVTLLGPVGLTPWVSTPQSETDYAEVLAAARELVAAEDAVAADEAERRERYPFNFP